MKIKRGVNPDFADWDELDTDAMDAIIGFEAGTVTYEELQHLIGPEEAHKLLSRREADDMGSFFEDDDDYDLDDFDLSEL